MSLKIATESLSREEMRMITGGSGGNCPTCTWKTWTCNCGYGSYYTLMTDACDPTCDAQAMCPGGAAVHCH